MTERAWKRTERGVAAMLGGTRTPINGRGDAADVAHARFAIEVKDRSDLPAWLIDAMRQAESAAYVAGGGMPIVVVHSPGWHMGSSLVVVRLKHFRELAGGDVL